MPSARQLHVNYHKSGVAYLQLGLNLSIPIPDLLLHPAPGKSRQVDNMTARHGPDPRSSVRGLD
jgi:hypothetical protein